MVTSLTPVRRAIWACVNGTPSSSEARYRAPAAIPTGEFASRTFESFTWATRAKARSPTRGSRPSCDANRGTKSSARLARLKTPSSRLTTFAVSEIRWTVTPVASESSWSPRGAPSCFAARYTTAATIASIDRPRDRPASIAFRKMIAARSRNAGASPRRDERLDNCARPGAKARSVRSYRVHWLTRRRRFRAATLRASLGFPFASRRPLPTIDPSPLSGAITDGGGPARIRSSPSNVVQSGPWSTRLSSTTKPQLSHTRSPRTGSTYRAKLPQFGQRAGSEPEGSGCSSRLNVTLLAFVDVNWLIASPREERNS